MTFPLRSALTFLILIWIAGIFIEWLIPHWQSLTIIFPFIKQAYSAVCHQESGKLIVENGYATLVCSRCSGIYVGFFISSIMILFVNGRMRTSLLLLSVSAALLLLDVILYSVGLYAYSKTIAFATGFLLGSVGFLYFYSALIELIRERKAKAK